MTALQRRVLKLEARLGTTVPAPWEQPGWEALSEAAQMAAAEDYCATHPDSRVAQQLRALETLTDAELEAVLAACQKLIEAPTAVRVEGGVRLRCAT